MLGRTAELFFVSAMTPVYVTIVTYVLFLALGVLVLREVGGASAEVVASAPSSWHVSTTVVLLFFLNLAGVPPLPGFFIKSLFLIKILTSSTIVSVTIVVILNFILFYFYARCYQAVGLWGRSRVTCAVSATTTNLNLLYLGMVVFWYPLYQLLGVWL